MRPLLPGDLDAAARVIIAAKPVDRPATAVALLRASEEADRLCRATGKAHPRFGTGSVMAAAAAWAKSSLPNCADDEYCRALAIFIEAYLDFPPGRGLKVVR